MKTGREMNQETKNPSPRKRRTLFRQNEQNPQNEREIHFVHFVNSVEKILLIHEGFLKLARCAFEVRGRAKQYSNTLALSHANRPDL